MKLGPRLKAVADMIPAGSVVADIGTDHGYLPVYLVEQGVSVGVVATDVNQGPLNKAIEQIRFHRLEDRIITRLGRGLNAVTPGEVNVVVIAGMGGVLITDILHEGRRVIEKAELLVLQPMNAQESVRRWLVENGFSISDEVLAMENRKIYEIIAAVHGSQTIEDPIHYEIGQRLIEKKDPLLPLLLEMKIGGCVKVVHELMGVDSPGAKARLEEFQQRIRWYKEVMEYCR